MTDLKVTALGHQRFRKLRATRKPRCTAPCQLTGPGKVEGNRLTFEVAAGKGTFIFHLKLVGDEITGNLQFKGDNETRTAKVSLKRVGI